MSLLISLLKATEVLFMPELFIFLSFIISFILFFKGLKREGSFFFGSIFVSSAFVYILKNLVKRPRPLGGLILKESFSFPSGHATISLVFFGFLTFLLVRKYPSKKKLFILSSSFLILFISLTRILLGVHWIGDVVGGLVIGSFVLIVSISKFLKK